MNDIIRADAVLIGKEAEEWVSEVSGTMLQQMRKRLDEIPLEDQMVNRIMREAFRTEPDAFALIIIEKDEQSGERVIVRIYDGVLSGSQMVSDIYNQIEEMSGASIIYERE